MTGIAQFNFPEFDEAAANLRKKGYEIVSPAEMDNEETRAAAMASPDGAPDTSGPTWGDFLARDVKLIADDVQGVILMPDWHLSRGARLEAFVAILCGHQFLAYSSVYKSPYGIGIADVKEKIWIYLED